MRFQKWLLFRVLFDIIAVVPFVVISAVVYAQKPYERGYFPNDDSIKLPYHESTVKSIYLFTVIPIIAVIIIVATELVRASTYGFDTRYKGIYLVVLYLYKFLYLLGFGYAIVSMFVHIGKVVIGRLRPNFFSVCGPQPTNITAYGYIKEFTCSETIQSRIDEMRLSFPSGHSAYSMFPAMFIVVYLHYRMPAIGMGSAILAFVQTLAVTAAFYVGLSRVTDNKHHWTDVLAGFLIGIIGGIYVVRYATDVHEFEEAEDAEFDENQHQNSRPRDDSSLTDSRRLSTYSTFLSQPSREMSEMAMEEGSLRLERQLAGRSKNK